MKVRRSLPELPEAKRQRYVDNGVPAHAAGLLVGSRDRAEFFEQRRRRRGGLRRGGEPRGRRARRHC